MNKVINKETAVFILQAIEKLSLAILTGEYDNEEIDGINQEAGIHLYDLKKNKE
ncbi:hypothetical protein P4V41_07590 [Fictibacillus nanhaiensis]|uniref:hypothetical protein n=1 Tax=Fictibacillus nanhaiensis TaxID=742169 RepID=UPI002E1CD3CC|nr:hypothetical protein [Fictibacillus nanhaiensis]